MAEPDPVADVHKALWTAWANCPHGNEPWPCKRYRAITAELLRKDGN